MIPTETRLLKSIASEIQTLSEELDGAHSDSIFNIQIALTELLLRKDHAFNTTFCKTGLDLIDEGTALQKSVLNDSKKGQTPASSTHIKTDLKDNDINDIAAALEKTVHALIAVEKNDAQIPPYLQRVVNWENSLYERRQHINKGVEPNNTQTAFDLDSIQSYFRSTYPNHEQALVSNVKTLSGGFSKTTVLFDLVTANSTESLVIRAEQPLNLLFTPGSKVTNEFYVLKFLYDAGIKVAKPLWLEKNKNALGERFLLSEKARGDNFGNRVKINDSLSTPIIEDLIKNLVQIHNIPIDVTDNNIRTSHLSEFAQIKSRKEAIKNALNMWEEGIKALQLPPSPLLYRTLGWLKNNIPCDQSCPVVLHGDYGLHNILVADNQVSCILDWESASIGDPAEDLAWLIDGLGAQIDRTTIIEIYEKESGVKLSEYSLRYFEVFNVLKFSVICPTALSLFEKNPQAKIDACQLGLLYMYHGTSKLNAAIELAEKSKT